MFDRSWVTLPLCRAAALALTFVGWGGSVRAQQEEAPRPHLKGFCPVSYVTEGKAVRGAPGHSVTYHGRLYYLCNEGEKKKFEAEPEKYLPQFGGLCTTSLGGPYGNRFAGDPEVFDVHDDKVYLFSSERAKRAYMRDPDSYIRRAEALFKKPALEGICPVTYQTAFEAVAGNEEFAEFHGKWLYHMVNAEALDAFRKDPERYIPEFEGNCVMTLVHESRAVPGDPDIFIVSSKMKTYMFRNKSLKLEFMTNPGRFVLQAQENWERIQKEE